MAAHFPEPITILGNPMQSFCIGHELLLIRFGVNPHKRILTLDEALLVIAVCRLPFREAERWLMGISWGAEIKAWVEAIEGQVESGNAEGLENVKLWVSYYLRQGLDGPPVSSDGDGDGSSVPLVEIVIQTLCREFGYQPEDVMTMHRPLAMWRFWAYVDASPDYKTTVGNESSDDALIAAAEEARNGKA